MHLACHLLFCCLCLNGLKGCSVAGGETKTAARYKLFWLLCVQVLEGMLERASHLCSVLHVVGNLLSTQCDAELLDHFCQELNVPLSLLCLAKQILETGCTKQQPWCIAVLTDLLMVTKVYFSSECSLEESGQKDSASPSSVRSWTRQTPLSLHTSTPGCERSISPC